MSFRATLTVRIDIQATHIEATLGAIHLFLVVGFDSSTSEFCSTATVLTLTRKKKVQI